MDSVCVSFQYVFNVLLGTNFFFKDFLLKIEIKIEVEVILTQVGNCSNEIKDNSENQTWR